MKPVIRTYTPEMRHHWDAFVRQSFNGTFLHLRDYMDYHAGRFDDFSLLLYDENTLTGLLPAHREGDTLYSHNGLTFGGWINRRNYRLEYMRQMWDALLLFLKRNGIKQLILKEIPLFFPPYLSERNRTVFRFSGRVIFEAPFWIIDTRRPLDGLLNHDRKRSIARAQNLDVRPTEKWAVFWEILEQNLARRHQARPVHSLDEIRLLASRFPERIRLFGAFDGDEMFAGTVVYLYRHVLHFQYTSARPEPAYRSAVDKLVWEVIRSHYRRYAYISLGTALDGKEHAWSLAYWKYSFGAEPVAQYFWQFNVLETEPSI